MCWQDLRGVLVEGNEEGLGGPGGTWKCTGPRGIAYIYEMPKNKEIPERKQTNKTASHQVQLLEGEN